MNCSELKKIYEKKIQKLVDNAWEQDVTWASIEAWCDNFKGEVESKETEEIYALFILSKFIYFGKSLVREMLRSLYREHIEAPIIQRIRRNLDHSLDSKKIRTLYQQEIGSTRFIGVGNPAESGAHLLYFFRQVNYLPKNIFTDISEAFSFRSHNGNVEIVQRNPQISRYIFFDDLVGSGNQACQYLLPYLSNIRNNNPNIDFQFMSLFATSTGIERLNQKNIFDGKASCLFELDSSFKAFTEDARYFKNPPEWFDRSILERIIQHYGEILNPRIPLGYGNGQLLLGFSHVSVHSTT